MIRILKLGSQFAASKTPKNEVPHSCSSPSLGLPQPKRAAPTSLRCSNQSLTHRTYAAQLLGVVTSCSEITPGRKKSTEYSLTNAIPKLPSLSDFYMRAKPGKKPEYADVPHWPNPPPSTPIKSVNSLIPSSSIPCQISLSSGARNPTGQPYCWYA